MTGRYLLFLQLKKYSWSEVQTHTDPKDKWLVIEGQVYNITNWARRHPGGSRVISHYAGQDATVSAECMRCLLSTVLDGFVLQNNFGVGYLSSRPKMLEVYSGKLLSFLGASNVPE